MFHWFSTLSAKDILDFATYWVFFWSVVNAFLPPRELFKDASPITQRRYNTLLLFVAYYGSINIRKQIVGMYKDVQEKEVETAQTLQAGQIAQAEPGYVAPAAPPAAAGPADPLAPTQRKP